MIAAPAASAAARDLGLERVDGDGDALGDEPLDQRDARDPPRAAAALGSLYVTPLSAPTSMRSAPSATSASAWRTCASTVVRRTVSENESGPALTIPMTSGRPGRSSSTRPGRARRVALTTPARSGGPGGRPRAGPPVGPSAAGGRSGSPVSDAGSSPATSSGASVSTRSSRQPSATRRRRSVGPPSHRTAATPSSACSRPSASASRSVPGAKRCTRTSAPRPATSPAASVKTWMRASGSANSPMSTGTSRSRDTVATSGWGARPAAARRARWGGSRRLA